MSLLTVDTPSLILDETVMQRNIMRMNDQMRKLGVAFRPHLKTAKCRDVARRQLLPERPMGTVSTLKEAEYFFDDGLTDMIYAVGIAPHKLPRIQALRDKGCDIKILLDNVASAQLVSRYCLENRCSIPVLVEIDCDGHRSGIRPNDPALLDVASHLTDGAQLIGVLTHAGGSYDVHTPELLLDRARQERDGIVTAARRLRRAGHEIDIVSLGSTPTALSAEDLTGVTEVRAGVYVFFDLFQRGVGVCTSDDIAVSLLVTVIGHQPEKGWVITDGGWMALSRDRGTASQPDDCGYGLVCDVDGNLLEGLWVSGANQEHGIISNRSGAPLDPERYPIGTRLRILPNHACSTAAQHDRYVVIDGNREIRAVWPRIHGW
ncbi:MAG: DSD1 family PLP-dependent enzyme [Duodenibacillus sp.]|nr:DSD1 family PLP-dependent enzyme [Duodenibacillus sp.]